MFTTPPTHHPSQLKQYDFSNPPHFFALPASEQLNYVFQLLRHTKVDVTLGVGELKLVAFIRDCASGYAASNPYHSFVHAMDVSQFIYTMLFDMNASYYLTKEDIAALLISSIGHDIGHPGLNNLYLINAKSALAERYNNQSVLENHSVSLTQHLLQQHRILEKLKYQRVCQHTADASNYHNESEIFLDTLTECILATDMVQHFSLLERLHILVDSISITASVDNADQYSFSEGMYSNKEGLSELPSPPPPSSVNSCDGKGTPTTSAPTTPSHFSPRCKGCDNITHYPIEFRRALCSILLHAADISNAVRPWDENKHWSDLVNKEFVHQVELERTKNLPISPGLEDFDSHNETTRMQNQCRISIQFGEIIVKPFFQALSEIFPKMRVMMENLEKNLNDWRSLAAEWTHKASIEAAASENINVAKMKLGKLRNKLLEESIDHSLKSHGRRLSIAAGSLEIPEDWKDRLRKRTLTNRVVPHFSLAPSGKTMKVPPALQLRHFHATTAKDGGVKGGGFNRASFLDQSLLRSNSITEGINSSANSSRKTSTFEGRDIVQKSHQPRLRYSDLTSLVSYSAQQSDGSLITHRNTAPEMLGSGMNHELTASPVSPLSMDDGNSDSRKHSFLFSLAEDEEDSSREDEEASAQVLEQELHLLKLNDSNR